MESLAGLSPVQRGLGQCDRGLHGAFQRAGVIDELSLTVAPIVADAGDKPLFMNSAMENDSLEDVQHRNGSLWLNYRR